MNYKYINNPTFYNENEEIKSTYDKNFNRQFGKRIPIHIFGSSSEGNSIYLKPWHILIDLGLTMKKYNEYNTNFFLDIDYIIITHHHGDHLNPATLKYILKNYPHIKIIMLPFMWEYITSDAYRPEYYKRKPDEIVPFGHDPVYQTHPDGTRIKKPPKYKPVFESYVTHFLEATPKYLTSHNGRKIWFEPLTVKHGDIVNMAIQLAYPDFDFTLLYASDLDNLKGERAFTDYQGRTQHITGLHQERLYSCIFLEANYDEKILQAWLDNLDVNDPEYYKKKSRADGNARHISEQETLRYIQKHLKDGGLFIPLHASKTFGTLHQD